LPECDPREQVAEDEALAGLIEAHREEFLRLFQEEYEAKGGDWAEVAWVYE
jgi:hypothetical protein